MKLQLILVILVQLWFGTSNAFHLNNTRYETLQMIQVIVQNADYNKTLIKEIWHEAVENITQMEMERARQFGESIRRRYSGWLDRMSLGADLYSVSHYDPNALCTLAGIFPDEQADNLTCKTAALPTSIPSVKEMILTTMANCPKLQKLRRHAEDVLQLKTTIIKEKVERFFETLSVNSGRPVNSLDDAVALFEAILFKKRHNIALHLWEKKAFGRLKKLYILQKKIEIHTREQKRLQAGPVIRNILDNIQDRVEQKICRQVAIYSVSEQMLRSLLSLLNVTIEITTPTSPTVIVELHQINGNPHIQIMYQPEEAVEPEPVPLPTCANPCPLSTVRRLVASALPNPSTADQGSAPQDSGFSAGTIALTVCIAVAGAVAVAAGCVLVTRMFSSKKGYQKV